MIRSCWYSNGSRMGAAPPPRSIPQGHPVEAADGLLGSAARDSNGRNRGERLLTLDPFGQQSIGDVQLPSEREALVTVQVESFRDIRPPIAEIGRIEAILQKLKQVRQVSRRRDYRSPESASFVSNEPNSSDHVGIDTDRSVLKVLPVAPFLGAVCGMPISDLPSLTHTYYLVPSHPGHFFRDARNSSGKPPSRQSQTSAKFLPAFRISASPLRSRVCSPGMRRLRRSAPARRRRPGSPGRASHSTPANTRSPETHWRLPESRLSPNAGISPTDSARSKNYVLCALSLAANRPISNRFPSSRSARPSWVSRSAGAVGGYSMSRF